MAGGRLQGPSGGSICGERSPCCPRGRFRGGKAGGCGTGTHPCGPHHGDAFLLFGWCIDAAAAGGSGVGAGGGGGWLRWDRCVCAGRRSVCPCRVVAWGGGGGAVAAAAAAAARTATAATVVTLVRRLRRRGKELRVLFFFGRLCERRTRKPGAGRAGASVLGCGCIRTCRGSGGAVGGREGWGGRPAACARLPFGLAAGAAAPASHGSPAASPCP